MAPFLIISSERILLRCAFQEHEKFMGELTLFTVSVKNILNDAPDSRVMLVNFLAGGVNTVTVTRLPF